MNLYLSVKTLAFNMNNKNKPFELIQEWKIKIKEMVFPNFHSKFLFFSGRSIHELKLTKILLEKKQNFKIK